jgi:hypothetical protein
MYLCRWLLPLVCVAACAQDPFEIQVFEYEPLPLGAFTYETHLNYVLAGTTEFDGPVAPLQGQLHFSSEWTAGITDQIRAGFVVLTAVVPGLGIQYGGLRVLPHFYAPKSWGLPVNVGFVAELSFERPIFDQDTRHVELRGIIEKHIGRLQMDGNVVLERALHGPGIRNGWDFEPSVRVGWRAWKTLTPSLEYYGDLGPAGNLLPRGQQIHLLFPGADWKIGERLTWSFGVGLGATDAGSQVILKSRIEYEFGGKHDRTSPESK